MKEDVVKQSQKSIKDSNPDSVKNLFDASQNAERNDDENSKYIGTESDGAKTKLVARVKADTGYGFYDARGEKVLPAEYQWLKNDMYPNNGEFDYNFYLRKDGETNHLYYIDVDGAVDLGQVKDAIPLSEDLVAVCRRGAFYGIIDKKGDKVMDANKFGRIIGISKDGYKVCELEKDIFGLVDENGNIVVDGRQHLFGYIVNPRSSLICVVNYKNGRIIQLLKIVIGKAVTFPQLFQCNPGFQISKVCVYNEVVIVEGLSKSEKSTILIDASKISKDSSNSSKKVKNSNSDSWKGSFYYGEEDFFELVSPIRSIKAKFISYKNSILISKTKDDYVINSDFKHRFGKIYAFGQNASFVAVENRSIVFGMVDNNQTNYTRLIEYGEGFKVGIYDAITLGNYMVIHYWTSGQTKERAAHTIIIDSQGTKIKEDHFNQYEFLCGPFEDAYYYLEGGEMNIIHEGEEDGKVASDGLHAEMMWPLGLTEHFLIKKNKEYQIVDSCGALLGKHKPFNIVAGVDMDSICNSKFIPIVDAEGKLGRIDTDGNVIVPCEFTEVSDLK